MKSLNWSKQPNRGMSDTLIAFGSSNAYRITQVGVFDFRLFVGQYPNELSYSFGNVGDAKKFANQIERGTK